jgi:hypothetical protein
MSLITKAWQQLYRAQTKATGVAIVATVEGYARNKPAILSKVSVDSVFVPGGDAEGGDWNLQMLASDFSSEPPAKVAITCNGDAAGHDLEVLSIERNNGVLLINAADFAAVTR